LPDLAGYAVAVGTSIALWPAARNLGDRILAAGPASRRRRVAAATPFAAMAIVSGGLGAGTQVVGDLVREPPLPAISYVAEPVEGVDELNPVVIVGNPLEDQVVARFDAPDSVAALQFVTYEYDDGTRCAEISAVEGSRSPTSLGSVNLTSDRRRVVSALPTGSRCPGDAPSLSVERQAVSSIDR
jgi:hypothetical protein